ncbi:hypothetical protein PoB_005538300 [Plakobranchus ocellatus]|uniref:Uncharacterized protein n=1 Tax=Plakobranchus ocellatus TaxID=259542 RepID=A0AAV4CBL6_9GAST|nr:hypothetical protein PoB_005538300 [Plakobranchus ocellatus]
MACTPSRGNNRRESELKLLNILPGCCNSEVNVDFAGTGRNTKRLCYKVPHLGGRDTEKVTHHTLRHLPHSVFFFKAISHVVRSNRKSYTRYGFIECLSHPIVVRIPTENKINKCNFFKSVWHRSQRGM